MSITEPGRTSSQTEVRGRASDSFKRRATRETKPSFMTTEFWAMLIGVVALIVIYATSADASLDLWRACLLATILAIGYMASRGLAKSGSRDVYRDDESGSRR